MKKLLSSLRHRLWFAPSTLEFFRQAGRLAGFSWYDRLHGYAYGHWTYEYIGLGIGTHPLARRLRRWWKLVRRRRRNAGPAGRRPRALPSPYPPRPGPGGVIQTGTIADTYHGKVISLETARRLVTINEPISLPQPEAVIPFAKARDLILQHPDHIAVLDCPCRFYREHPCRPLDVCLIVGEPFASFVREHHPDRSRWITAREAVKIIELEDDRGHVHHAFFKDAMLGRFYAICNCCACCCGAMQNFRLGAPMLISSGYVCEVDVERCMACGECEDYCQFHALRFTTEAEMQSRLYGMVVDQDACMGCGICTRQCVNGALSLRLAPEKGQPLEIG